MFKIESYITPLLMGYVDKYVKLRHEDFQLSLWGGDVVLNNLELRLDFFEKLLQIPVTFKSGRIHELRIHVPWTKLGSEPVVITINTIECILKVRDTAYEEASSSTSGDLSQKQLQASKVKAKLKKQDTEELPPGYIQGIVNRVINNVAIVINNLIVKFVEDDIVLSLNVKSAECYAVDLNWNRAFVDFGPPESTLRKVINFCDLTVCLDKSDASGKIQEYQEPLLYKCSVSCRILMTYESITAKIPKVTRFNLFCEELNVTFNDTQLPMFIRLIEMCIALYYGVINVREVDETEPNTQEVNRTTIDENLEKEIEVRPEDEVGWGSWAMSWIYSEVDEENTGEETLANMKDIKPIISIGFYIHKATLLFKLTDRVKDSSLHASSSSRLQFNPFLFLEVEGLTSEILIQSITFVNAQVGVTCIKLRTEGPCACGEKDANDSRSSTMLIAGDKLSNKTGLNYISHSLFDEYSRECQGQLGEYHTTNDSHLENVTESYAMQRYGAFWFDHIYSWQNDELKTGTTGSKSSLTSEGDGIFQREHAVMRFLFGFLHVNLTSTFLHRVQKVIQCANNHQYLPYNTPIYVEDEGDKNKLTEEQIQSLEEFIPTRSCHVTLLQPIIIALPPEHEKWDGSKKSNKPNRKTKDSKSSTRDLKTYPLPAVKVAATRFDFQTTTPMYPKKLVKLVSNIAGPSSNLLYHCHSHTQLKVLDLHGGLQKISGDGTSSHLHTVIPPCNGVVYFRELVSPQHWNSSSLPHSESMYELPQLSVSVTKPCVLLLMRMASSWIQMKPDLTRYTDDSLCDDIFPSNELQGTSMPVLDLVITGVELKSCTTSLVSSYTGNLTSLQLLLYSKEAKSTRVMPILYGPSDTRYLELPNTLVRQKLHLEDIKTDCLVFTIQIPHNTDITEAPAVLLLGLEGITGYLDPKLNTWFHYTPRLQPSAVKQKEITVDMALAHAASPLQNISQVSLHSSSSVTHPTSSRPQTQSQSQIMSPNALSSVVEATGDCERPENKSVIANWYPLIRMLNVQVELKNSCIYTSSETFTLRDPSMDVTQNINMALLNNTLRHLVVINLPAVTIHSSDIKQISALQEIPIQSLEGSLIGEKLPWNLNLSKFTIYSIHDNQKCLPILKPLDVKSTIAVSCKYTPPTSQHISSLGLNLLVNFEPLTVAASQEQIELGLILSQQVTTLINSSLKLAQYCIDSLISETKVTKETKLNSSQEKVESGISIDEEGVQEVSEEASQNESPIHENTETGNSEGLQLTMWTMIVLPKITMKFYSRLSNIESCMKLCLDDLSTSIDIQAVYSKVKLNLARFNVNNYQKLLEEKDWKKGACEGILISSMKEITRDVHIVSNKFWNHETHAIPTKSLFPSQDPSTREQTQGFLFLTFTRALCKNTTKRMKKRSMDVVPGLTDIDNVTGQCELYFHKYISEICLKVEPCDVIIYPPVIRSLLAVFESNWANREPPSARRNISNMADSNIPIVSAHTVPLLYINLSSVRIFLPETEDKGSNSDVPETRSTLDHNTLIVQLNSVDINPQADNPLPRYPMKRELYHRALAAGLTQYPGASVEDRQYQMDIKGLTLCTGYWNDFMKSIKHENRNNPDFPSIQMPALEWNTVLSLQQKEKDEIKLIPITLPFDLRVVAAPAIVYEKREADIVIQRMLVCGFSTEVNVTSDLDLYVSTNQIHLINRLVTNCIQIIQSPTQTQKPFSTNKKSRTSDLACDSGISDMSTVTNDRQPIKFQAKPAPSISSDVDLKSKVMAFDLLLTAGRISCTMYSHQVLTEDFHPEKIKVAEKKVPSKTELNRCDWLKDNLPSNSSDIDQSDSEYLHPSDSCTNFGFLKVHRDSSGSTQDIAAGTTCIQPFMYIYIAQPHTLLSCNTVSQKFEMSCYDIIVRGSECQSLIPVSECQIIPDCSDFNLYWVETRAGQPNIKTGIPPSLFTVQIKDFLNEPACIVLKFERPVKGNIDLYKITQLQDFITEIVPPTNKMAAQQPEKTSQSTSDVTSSPGILSKIDHIEVVTEQVVVSMETIPNNGSASCMMSTSCFRVDTEFTHNAQGGIETITGRFHVKDIFLTSNFQSNILPFVGPTSFNLETIFHWTEHSGPKGIPKTLVAMETGMIPVKFGQEHFQCFEAIVKDLEKFFKGDNCKSKEELSNEGKKSPVAEDSFICDASEDDFKSGGLEYVFGPENSEIQPNPREIIFSRNLADGSSSMTWCYHQSRVLRHAELSPLPFNLEDGSTLQIECVLQYWDTATRQFLDYIHFRLSETDSSILDLPQVIASNSSDLITSQMWRIIISPLGNSDCREPIIQPSSLVACMKLDSCFIPGLIPFFQMCLGISLLELQLLNHLQDSHRDVPSKLKPFYFTPEDVTTQEIAVLRLDNLSVTANHIEGRRRSSSIQVTSTISADILDNEYLTMSTILQPFYLQTDLDLLYNEKPALYTMNIKGEKMKVRLGKGAVHSINMGLQAWISVISKEEKVTCPVYGHYVICNNTQQALRFGQVGTDENLIIQPREMQQYGWRSHKMKQILHLCVDHTTWKWCDPFEITSPGSIIRAVHSKDQNFTIIIKIKQISNIQKQIIFCGQLILSNRLSQNIEIKLTTINRDSTVADATSIIPSNQTMPSVIVEHEDIREIKLRLPGLQSSPWSQEIHISGEKMKSSRLVKIPLANKAYIHLWCHIYTQHYFNNKQQNLACKNNTATCWLVLFSPLYVLRTHLPRPLFVEMDSPKLDEKQQLEIPGQAREYQLHCVGGDITHSLAFRLGQEMEKSSPPLMLSTGLIDQVDHEKINKIDIDSICEKFTTDLSTTWPYCDVNVSASAASVPHITSTCPSDYHDIPQPSVELSVRLSEYLPGCNTLLVDITPESLVTNLAGIELMIVANQQNWCLGNGKTFTLPHLKTSDFEVGYMKEGVILKSAAIPLSNEEVSSKLYSTDIGRVLFIDGLVQVTIVIPGHNNQILYLTVKSEVQHGMRIITIREGFCFINQTNIPLVAQLISLPLGSSKMNIPGSGVSQESIPVSQQPSVNSLRPLLFWSLYSTHDLRPQTDNFTQYIHYLLFKDGRPPSNQNQDVCQNNSDLWSIPIRVAANAEGMRHTVSIPQSNREDYYSRPYCLCGQIKNGVTYLTLMEDYSSICVLYNNCPFPVLYGQTLMNITLSDITIQEEAELLNTLPRIPPGGHAHYTMPHLNSVFPLPDGFKYPKVHFCSETQQTGIGHSPWSLGVDLMSGNTFVKLPQVADVKIEVQRKAGIIEVVMEPVGKAEISAREIRSRLKGGNQEIKITESEKSESHTQSTVELKPLVKRKARLKENVSNIFIGCYIDHFSLAILDETTSMDTISEVLRLSMDRVFLATYPVTSQSHSSSVSICIGNLQLDNQAYGSGQFDFPVIILPQQKTEPYLNLDDIESLSVIERYAVFKSSSFLNFQIVMSSNCLDQSVIESLDVSMKPASLYIDDMFIYRLLKEVELLLPASLSADVHQTKCEFPNKDILSVAYCLSNPIRIQHLSIQPIKILLSVHASMKLYLAADHTPLSFSCFERRNLCTTSTQLVRAVVMHYASGAIFRAGIVIGSLEILGNPTGLVRSFSIGMADLVRMPYSGLTRGPGAFVSGISGGMGSLFRNVSAGMITSITNLASSVSRNMDRLSMDGAHLERQEENRRNRPIGLSDGLRQGFTGFGLSLLGAVAGLADQPLQNVISTQDGGERRSSTSAMASGLVTGMGKGLVGIVTKPIGGAAELVSQTGQGILHGTGLGQLPQRLEKPRLLPRSVASNAIIKYPLKIFQSLPTTQFLISVDACHLDLVGLEVMVTLILTSDILFVVNNEEDAQQQAFSIRELECFGKSEDPSLISLIWTDNLFRAHTEQDNSNSDRVAAFVDSAPTFGPSTNEEGGGNDSQSDGTSVSGSVTAPQYDFHVNPEFRNSFIAMFNIVKHKILSRGFPLL